jgi:ABC-2 type transport system ATP-binding protein
VGGDRLEIHLCDGRRGEEAIPVLAPISGEQPAANDGFVSVPLRQRSGAIADAVRRLDDAGIAIDDIALRSPTLDDVFLKLTGRATEQEDQE